MNRIESSKDDRTEQLVDTIMTTIWLKGVLKQYRDLPKQTGRERKVVKNLVTKTSAGLLQNPQDISIADKTWQRHEACENQAQKLEEPFSELVRKERLELIKDKWGHVTPEQLAGLVRAREFGQDLLKNYFKGPRSLNQQIDAYYNFFSGVLDLAEEEEAFITGMKIALHATDILPKNPSLAEQNALLYFPYGVDKKVLQKLLVPRRIVARVCLMDRWGLEKYYQERENFLETDSQVKEIKNNRRKSVIEKIGSDRTAAMYNVMRTGLRIICDFSQEPLFEEGTRTPVGVADPLKLSFDPDDPLNQKFKRVFAENRSNSV